MSQLFYIGEDKYDIPDNLASRFVEDYPQSEKAKSYKINDEIYDIPESANDTFKSQYPDAKPYFPQLENPIGYTTESIQNIMQSERGMPRGGDVTLKVNEVSALAENLKQVVNAEVLPSSTVVPGQLGDMAHLTKPRAKETIDFKVQPELETLGAQAKYVPARIISAVIEKPAYAMTELGFRGVKLLSDITGFGKETSAYKFIEDAVDFYSQPQKHGVFTPYAQKMREYLTAKNYNAGYGWGLLTDIAESGTDISAMLLGIKGVNAVGKIGVGSKLAQADLTQPNILKDVGKHARELGVWGFTSTSGDISDRLQASIHMIGYSITPYVVGAMGLTNWTARGTDVLLNTFLSSPTYIQAYKQAGGINKEFISAAVPQFVADVAFAWNTKGLPENIYKKQLAKEHANRAKELNMSLSEYDMLIRTMQQDISDVTEKKSGVIVNEGNIPILNTVPTELQALYQKQGDLYRQLKSETNPDKIRSLESQLDPLTDQINSYVYGKPKVEAASVEQSEVPISEKIQSETVEELQKRYSKTESILKRVKKPETKARLEGELDAISQQLEIALETAKPTEESPVTGIKPQEVEKIMPEQVEKPNEEYRGQHRPMTVEGGSARLHDLTSAFGEDIYGKSAVQIYGDGDKILDNQTVKILQSLRGKPESEINVYRAIPKDSPSKKLVAGDWVTVNKQYAKEHGEGILGGEYKIIEQKVKVKDLTTNPDSFHEQGYYPMEQVVPEPITEPPAKPVVQQTPEVKTEMPKTASVVESLSDRYKIIETPLSEINIDIKSYQNRGEAYSKETYESILNDIRKGEFDWKRFDPIVLWKNPKTGNLDLLKGHSRKAAFEQAVKEGYREYETIPSYLAEGGTFEEAQRFAKERSNVGQTREMDYERAKIYRINREEGMSKKDILSKAKELEGRNAPYIVRLSHLNPRGDSIRLVESLARSADKNEVGRAEKIADWIGRARVKYPELTDSHETEIFNWLFGDQNNIGMAVRLNTAEQFLDRVDAVVNRIGFEKDKPLNIKHLSVKSEGELQYAEEISSTEKELKQANTHRLDIATRLGGQGLSPDEISKNEVHRQAVADVVALDRKLEKLRLGESNVKTESRKQANLFDSAINQTKIELKNEGLTNEQVKRTETIFSGRKEFEIADFESKVESIQAQEKPESGSSTKSGGSGKEIQLGLNQDAIANRMAIVQKNEGEASRKELEKLENQYEEARNRRMADDADAVKPSEYVTAKSNFDQMIAKSTPEMIEKATENYIVVSDKFADKYVNKEQNPELHKQIHDIYYDYFKKLDKPLNIDVKRATEDFNDLRAIVSGYDAELAKEDLPGGKREEYQKARKSAFDRMDDLKKKYNLEGNEFNIELFPGARKLAEKLGKRLYTKNQIVDEMESLQKEIITKRNKYPKGGLEWNKLDNEAQSISDKRNALQEALVRDKTKSLGIDSPAKDRSTLLSYAHILERESGKRGIGYSEIKKDIIGVKSLKDASDAQIQDYINILRPTALTVGMGEVRKTATESLLDNEWNEESIISRIAKTAGKSAKTYSDIGSRFVESMEHALNTKFGESTKEFVRLKREAEIQTNIKVNPLTNEMELLYSKIPIKERNVLRNIIENPEAISHSKEAQVFVDWFRNADDNILNEGAKTINPNVQRIENHFPLVLKETGINLDVNSKEGQSVVRYVAKVLQIKTGKLVSQADAKDYLIKYLNHYKRHGTSSLYGVFAAPGAWKHDYPLELHRDRILPERYYENNVYNVLHKYIYGSWEAIEHARQFGRIEGEYKYEKVDNILKQVEKDGYNAELARDMVATVLHIKSFNHNAGAAVKLAKNLTSFLLSTKTAIKNYTDLSKSIALANEYSLGEYQIKRLVNKEERRLAGEILGSKQVFTQALEEAGLSGRAANIWSSFIGFKHSEKAVRKSTAMSAIHYSEHIVNHYNPDKPSEFLKRRFATLSRGLDIETVKKSGGLTKEQKLRIGINAISMTQPTSPLDKPYYWESSPAGQIATIYKSFGHKSLRFAKDYTISEMGKGNPMPFLRWIVWGAALGYGSERLANFIFPKNNDDKKDADNLAVEMAKSFATSGHLGFFGDLVFTVKYSGWNSPIVGLAFGPFASLSLDNAQAVAQTTHNIVEGNIYPFEPLGRQAGKYTIKRIPLYGESMYKDIFDDINKNQRQFQQLKNKYSSP